MSGSFDHVFTSVRLFRERFSSWRVLIPFNAKSDIVCNWLSVISNCFNRWKRMKSAFGSSSTRQSWIMISSGLGFCSPIFRTFSTLQCSRWTLSLACTKYFASAIITSTWFMIVMRSKSFWIIIFFLFFSHFIDIHSIAHTLSLAHLTWVKRLKQD